MGLRVGLVTPRFSPSVGGVQTVVERLAEALAERACEVDVLTQATRAASGAEWRGLYRVLRFALAVRSDRFPLAPGLVAHLRAYSSRYDVVHVHDYHSASAIAATAVSQAPVVFSPHYHGGGHTPAARLLHVVHRPLARRVFAAVPELIVVSRAEQTLLEADFPDWRGRRTVIPNGADILAIRAAAPQPAGTPVVLIATRLEAYKRVAQAIDAFAAADPDARLVVLGGGPEQARLRERAAPLGDRVVIAGQVPLDELRSWLRSAAVVVTLSEHEAFGLTVVEGLAAGARVVASDIAAHREVRAYGAPWVDLVAPDADAATIGRVIRGALEAPRPLRDLALPTWDDAASRVLAVYERVSSRPTASRPSTTSDHQRR